LKKNNELKEQVSMLNKKTKTLTFVAIGASIAAIAVIVGLKLKS
jgi:hypothetical protein